jgi:hypothetical protein
LGSVSELSDLEKPVDIPRVTQAEGDVPPSNQCPVFEAVSDSCAPRQKALRAADRLSS